MYDGRSEEFMAAKRLYEEKGPKEVYAHFQAIREKAPVDILEVWLSRAYCGALTKDDISLKNTIEAEHKRYLDIINERANAINKPLGEATPEEHSYIFEYFPLTGDLYSEHKRFCERLDPKMHIELVF